MKFIKNLLKYFMMFSFGGMLYYLMEVAYRGYSFPSMYCCGGIMLICLGLINDFAFTEKMPIWLQMIIGGALITGIELTTGLLVNQDHSQWDYSNMFCNFKGQICLQFSIIWCFVSCIGIFLEDYLNYFFFGDDKPKYYLTF